MNIEIKSPGPPLAISSIEAFESQIGGTLPDQYRDFLEKYNGGRPSPDTIDISGLPDSPTDVQVFFGIGGPIESSDLRWRAKVYDSLVKMGMLPVACDSGGNLFCLVLQGKYQGRVVYYDIASPETPPYDVAADFSQFLGAIREFQEP